MAGIGVINAPAVDFNKTAEEGDEHIGIIAGT